MQSKSVFLAVLCLTSIILTTYLVTSWATGQLAKVPEQCAWWFTMGFGGLIGPQALRNLKQFMPRRTKR